MIKIKKIGLWCLVLISSLMLFSCNDKQSDEGDSQLPEVYPIGLDIVNPVTTYAVGDGFTMGELEVNAHFSNGTVKNVTDKITIDSTKFNSEKDGTYEIIISYVEENITAKTFYFAVVGSGQGSSGQDPIVPDVETFGPGTYTFNSVSDLATYLAGAPIAENTKFGTGYYIIKGTNAKRANATAFAIELGKEESSWIEFNVTGSATVTITCGSTGSSNTSAIALFDSENEVVANNEAITTVTDTTETTITYTIPTGVYRIVSPKSTAYSNRGVRVYSVTVTQG